MQIEKENEEKRKIRKQTNNQDNKIAMVVGLVDRCRSNFDIDRVPNLKLKARHQQI